MFALVRLCVAGAIAVTFGYTWTVGQGGLKQVNSNLCELWRSLPLWTYDKCEFQYGLVIAWLVVAFAVGVWLFIEVCQLIEKIKVRKNRLLAHSLLYTAYFRTRKSEGLITRKLSVTESRRASQFRGTSRVRKVIVFVLKSRNVA